MKKIFRVFFIIAFVALMGVEVIGCMECYARTKQPDGIQWEHGEKVIYHRGKLQTGLFKYKGNWYYGHITRDGLPRGSVTTDAYKVLWIHRGEQIAFGTDVDAICDRYERFLAGEEIV